MNWKVPLFKSYTDKDDINTVSKVIRRGTHFANGPEIAKFENELAYYSGVKYALTFNSGTSALHSVLLAYDIKDYEVIVPSFTFISTANAVVLAGGMPVFAEIEEETFGMDYEDVRKKINKKTKAVIIVHYAGCPAKDTLRIRELCKEKKILFIEDAAESMGAEIKGKKVGTIGDSGMYSFCQNKIITTGEGGAIITNSKEVYEKIKLIRSHGRFEAGNDYFSSTKDNDYIALGYNYRMTSMCAALGSSQLKKIDKLIGLRKNIAIKMNKGLKNIKKVKTPFVPDSFKHVYQMYTITLKDEKIRDSLQKFLESRGIMTKVYFNPAHLKTFYKKEYDYKERDLAKTEEISKKVLTLPLYPGQDKKEIEFIIKSVKEFFKVKGESNERNI